MLVQLGSRPPPSDVVDLLLACHERIRSFLALCERLAQPEPMPEAEVRQAAHFIGVYFREALPLHDSDEDLLVAPRLKGLSDEVDTAMQLMSQDHREHVPLVETLLSLCAVLEADPSRLAELRTDWGALTSELGGHFDNHLQLEETVIFPALRSLLPGALLVELMDEARARRR